MSLGTVASASLRPRGLAKLDAAIASVDSENSESLFAAAQKSWWATLQEKNLQNLHPAVRKAASQPRPFVDEAC